MILGTQSTIFKVDAFISGMQKARQGVFRILVGSNTSAASWCTGWLLTDRLVVTIDFSLSRREQIIKDSGFVCYRQEPSGETTQFDADLFFIPTKIDELGKVVLLQLHTPVPDAAPNLQSNSSAVGDNLILLHYPAGTPFLSCSMGFITEVVEGGIRYNADTLGGSSGAPLFNLSWEVVGFHHTANKVANANEGSSLSFLLDALRDSSAWPDIVKYHRLADLAAIVLPSSPPEMIRSLEDAKTTPANSLLRAAIYWDFEPDNFNEEEREALESMVIDPMDTRWMLNPDERQRLLKEAGSLAALPKDSGNGPSDDPKQAVIDRLLEGEPFDLDTVAEQDLPYWLQAVRWFEGIIPGLPSPQQVNQTLERLRIGSQFEPIAGAGFRGRKTELAKFQEWFDRPDAGPLAVSGIGGVGKSSLAARFALSLPSDTLLLWLDFDRADLAPNDGVSVLTLLSQQASVQLTDFKAPDLSKLTKSSEREQLQEAIMIFGQELSQSLTNTTPPLLVLDGFEVAQHVEQHKEIWDVLELVLAEVPVLKVIVSGRAPVKDRELLGRKVQSLDLKGIAPNDADVWLLDQGIANDTVRTLVVERTKGVPLSLKLAVPVAKAGGDLKNLLQGVEDAMVMGFLFERNVDRLMDDLLKPVALDALVLRKITPNLLQTVLADALPEKLNSSEVFDRLAREFALVDSGSVFVSTSAAQATEKTLWIRPDVRAATLRLLEANNAERVRELDKRAAEWYAQQPLTDKTNAAELIYHQLRMGNIAGAKAIWNNACVPYLLTAEDDLWPNDKKERSWLRRRLNRANNSEANKLLTWEKEAVDRLKDAQRKGLGRELTTVLGEKPDRSEHSPLLFYDAWLRYMQGDLPGAREILKNADEVDDPVGRDQVILAAQLATLANDRPEADRLLSTIANKDRWADRPDGKLEALAVRAARVRLTVDIDNELKLLELLSETKDEALLTQARTHLLKSDVLLPKLQALLETQSGYSMESYSTEETVMIPDTKEKETEFRAKLSDERRQKLDTNWADTLTNQIKSLTKTLVTGALIGDFLEDDMSFKTAKQIHTLALLGLQREERITEDLFLAEAAKNVVFTTRIETLSLSIGATLIAINGLNLSFFSLNHPNPLNTVLGFIWNQYSQQFSDFAKKQRLLQAEKIGKYSELSSSRMDWLASLNAETTPPYYKRDKITVSITEAKTEIPLLYVLGPDPLEVLCLRLLSLPDSFSL